jgi:hypothetical protein
MEPGVPESFKVLIKELQSLALDVKVLTENREEIDVRMQDDDMGDRERQEIGLLMGDDQPVVSQTQVAAREAVAEAAAEGVLDADSAAQAGVVEPEVEEEEEEEEIDDSKPLDATPLPATPPMPTRETDEEIFAEEEEPEDAELEEGVQGYELEEEDEESYEEEKPYDEDEEESYSENQNSDEDY